MRTHRVGHSALSFYPCTETLSDPTCSFRKGQHQKSKTFRPKCNATQRHPQPKWINWSGRQHWGHQQWAIGVTAEDRFDSIERRIVLCAIHSFKFYAHSDRGVECVFTEWWLFRPSRTLTCLLRESQRQLSSANDASYKERPVVC